MEYPLVKLWREFERINIKDFDLEKDIVFRQLVND